MKGSASHHYRHVCHFCFSYQCVRSWERMAEDFLTGVTNVDHHSSLSVSPNVRLHLTSAYFREPKSGAQRPRKV